ncbi:hypothetical protein ACFQY0_19455 [Haloferula chungangensis]|uniref:Transposase n=1 Tax=Haloferula chungangensis TaxID=1048331 RepID=A0ABW2LAB6_9BACT
MVFYLGSMPCLSANEVKILEIARVGLDEENSVRLRLQMDLVECVRPMFLGRFRITYVMRRPEARLTGRLGRGRHCLAKIDLKTKTGSNRVAVVIDDGWLDSLDFKTRPGRNYEVCGLSKSQKWVDSEKALNRLEHGSDDL